MCAREKLENKKLVHFATHLSHNIFNLFMRCLFFGLVYVVGTKKNRLNEDLSFKLFIYGKEILMI